jgi:hypothetical protein
VCIRLTLGLGNGCRFFAFGAPFYNAFVAAAKEALWHADTGQVRASALGPGAFGWYWYFLATPSLILDRPADSATLEVPFTEFARVHAKRFVAQGDKMKVAERRQLTRLNLRTPLRFRALGVAADKTEHFTEALNVSRGGFFFASSAPLQVGMPIEATLRMPAEVTGNSAQEMRCTARVVHVRNEPYGDGRIGFGAEIEKFQTIPAVDRWVS